MTHFYFILLIIGLPFGVPVLLLISNKTLWLRATSTSIAAITVGMIAYLISRYTATESFVLLDFLGEPFNLMLYMDSYSLTFAAMASFLWLITLLYSFNYNSIIIKEAQTKFYVFFAISLSAVFGVAFSGNLITLFFFYELLTFATIPLLSLSTYSNATESIKTYLYTLVFSSTFLLLPAILLSHFYMNITNFTAMGSATENLLTSLILVLFFFGIAKSAPMPLHIWLPKAMIAPIPVSALLHAVAVVKTGIFTFFRVITTVFGEDYLANSTAIQWISVLTLVFFLVSSFKAIQQNNLKYRLAYSTINQLALMLFSLTLPYPYGVKAAFALMLGHAFSKITLFFGVGLIQITSYKQKITEINRLGFQLPITFGLMVLASCSLMGLPFTAGYIAKEVLMEAASMSQVVLYIGFTVITAFSTGLYLLPLLWQAYFAPKNKESVPLNHLEKEFPFSLLAMTLTATMGVVLYLFEDAIFHFIFDTLHD